MLKTIGVGWLNLDYFKFVVISPTLEQILGSNVLKTVGVDWFGLDNFKVVVISPTLEHILGNNMLKTVGEDWFSSGLVSSALAWADPGQHSAQDC